ncbi:hypothetical protein ACFL6S_07740 [Candidatus Poribacteria bacterium]
MVEATMQMMFWLGYHSAYSLNRYVHHQDAGSDRRKIPGIAMVGKMLASWGSAD